MNIFNNNSHYSNRVKEAKNPKFFNYKNGDIELKNVTFRYTKESKSIYEKFSLKIPGK